MAHTLYPGNARAFINLHHHQRDTKRVYNECSGYFAQIRTFQSNSQLSHCTSSQPQLRLKNVFLLFCMICECEQLHFIHNEHAFRFEGQWNCKHSSVQDMYTYVVCSIQKRIAQRAIEMKCRAIQINTGRMIREIATFWCTAPIRPNNQFFITQSKKSVLECVK